MRDHVSELREGQNDTRGGSSETDVSEFTINPVGSPSGAAVTKATPVANLPSASRNDRAFGAGTAWVGAVAVAAGAISVERRFFAESDAAEVVVGAVCAERVHEGARLDVAVRARQRTAVHVAGAAREGERALDDARSRLVHEGLGGLRLGKQRAELRGAAVGRGVRGAVLVDQRGGTREDTARGGEVDRVVGHLHARARIAVDTPRDGAPGYRVGGLRDAERRGGVEEPGNQVALHVRQLVAGPEPAAHTRLRQLDALERDRVAAGGA